MTKDQQGRGRDKRDNRTVWEEVSESRQPLAKGFSGTASPVEGEASAHLERREETDLVNTSTDLRYIRTFTLFFYSTLVTAPVFRQMHPTQELGLRLQVILSYKIIKSQS